MFIIMSQNFAKMKKQTTTNKQNKNKITNNQKN